MGRIRISEISREIWTVLKQLSEFILDDSKVHDAPRHVLSPLNVAQFMG